ncbi:MAG: head GIN domain-containing protein [Pseudomonadota bacterium]
MYSISPRTLSALSTLVFAGVIALAVTPVQAGDWFGNKTVAASGNASSVKRELATFHDIAVSLNGRIELIQGTVEGVVVEADDNLLPLIETVVKNGQLRIRTAKGVNLPGNAKIKITVHARNIDTLSLAGSADLTAARLASPKLAGNIAGSGSITIKDLQSDDLSVSIAGSGSFEAQGTAKAMDVSIAGSGDVSTAKLSTQDVKISIAGSGDAIVWVRKALSVSIAGSGEVRYYGEGNLREASTMGSGRVKQLSATPPV